jgi:hypothetical protein
MRLFSSVRMIVTGIGFGSVPVYGKLHYDSLQQRKEL